MSRDPEDVAYISQLHDEATEAAQEIERLRAEVKRLRALLWRVTQATLYLSPNDKELYFACKQAAGRGEGEK